MPTLKEPSPAKQAQDEARNAQETSAAHEQALGELKHTENLSDEDSAVLGEWVLEGQGLKTDADSKVRASNVHRKENSYTVDGAGRILLDRDIKEIAAGTDRNPPVGGRVG